jgi:transposase InsO family protein
LGELIEAFFKESDKTYGSRRLRKDLNDVGEVVGRHTVRRLMRWLAVVPKTIKKFRVTTDSRKTIAAANLLKQEFHAEHPDQRWVSDITFVPTRQGWLYLAIVIDLFSRAVVGWSMAKRIKRALVIDALQMAIEQRAPEGLEIVHSDQGSQYTAGEYQELIAQQGAACSMSRKGCCWDNAVAESFFRTLKTELVHHEDYRTRAQARTSIFQYIEGFYNRRRRHSFTGNQPPLAFELNYATDP